MVVEYIFQFLCVKVKKSSGAKKLVFSMPEANKAYYIAQYVTSERGHRFLNAFVCYVPSIGDTEMHKILW